MIGFIVVGLFILFLIYCAWAASPSAQHVWCRHLDAVPRSTMAEDIEKYHGVVFVCPCGYKYIFTTNDYGNRSIPFKKEA